MDVSENTEQQTNQTIEDEGTTQSTKPMLTEKTKGKSASLPSAKARTSENREFATRKVSQKSTDCNKPAVITPRKSSTTGNSSPSVEEKCEAKGKGRGKGEKEKRLEKCEVFSLSLSSTVAKFTSSYDLVSVKESSNFLTSSTEVSELQSMEAQASKVSTVPVASLSYSSTSSRSSRTALILARGGKDPYASINQLPARAFNTHDFMTLNPCKIVLTLKDDSFENVADEENPHHRELAHAEGESKLTPDYSSTTEDAVKMLLNNESNDCCTSPVVVTIDVSIEDYIEQSKQDFGLNASDFPLARIIYSIVAESKEFGTPVEVLQERIPESHKHELSLSQFSLEQQLRFMCKAKVLYKVGSFTCCLVTASFVKPWCVTLLKPKDDSHPFQQNAPDTDRNVSLARDSLPVVMSNSLKQQEQSEKAQNASEIAEIYNENSSTTQTNQTGSTITQVADQTASSLLYEVDMSLLGNIVTSGVETTGQKSCSPEPAHDSPDNEVKTSERGTKKYKVRNYEQYSVICRPWVTIDGETSQQLLRMFREMVLMLILGNPGISQSQVSKHFFEALRPVALQDILDSLILDRCVVKHVRKLPVKVALFSTSKLQGNKVMCVQCMWNNHFRCCFIGRWYR
ncbi:general transcription factor 3C polypeptide 1-like isoform X4 [Orbicella faveolata]|nr:general transcription factor 3C polypeptide 1-like isoform X4 [Orbicella faveolata]